MSNFVFPELEEKIIVETEQMRRVISRTMAVHRGGALLPYIGRSRMGKTTTATYLNDLINTNFSSENPRTFRSIHYEVGEISSWAGNDQIKGIRSLYHACVGRLDASLYRGALAQDLARQLVYILKKKRIEMLFVDEAGNLSIDAIRGMVLVRNTAELEGWTLTIVFIGMDDLPSKLVSLPQIANRTDEWCYFEPYSLEETFEILKKLHSHFISLDLDKRDDREQVEFIYEQFGGVPGLIAPFIRRLKNQQDDFDEGIDLSGLIAVHLSTLRDKDKALSDSKKGYTGEISQRTEEELLKDASRKKKSAN